MVTVEKNRGLKLKISQQGYEDNVTDQTSGVKTLIKLPRDENF